MLDMLGRVDASWAQASLNRLDSAAGHPAKISCLKPHDACSQAWPLAPFQILL